MGTSAALLVVLLACGGGPKFLGEPIGDRCDEFVTCAAWANERALRTAARLEYRDPKLAAYVQGVLDRLVRANGLASRPRVVITEVGPTASAVIGDLIVMNRNALAIFDSEAELASLLAHELVHLDSDHSKQMDVESDPVWRLDMESAADERAVGFLRAAGYPAHAMLAMLRAIARDNTLEDPTHPTSLQRLARTARLVGDDAPRALEATEYRRRIEGLVLGNDPRLLEIVNNTVISIAADVVVGEPPDQSESITVNGTLVERPRGDDIAARLERRREHRLAGKQVITGVTPDPSLATTAPTPLEAVLRNQLQRNTRIPGDGTHVVLIRGDRDLVLELTGDEDLDRWTELLIHAIRRPTTADRASVKPYRLRYVPASEAGTYAEIAKRECASYAEFSMLDDPSRRVARGERIKCAVK